MNAETQKRVFEPFTQADTSTTREYGGTGLGLTISRHYIDLMGGDIAIHSAIGEGTKITLSIPMDFEPNAEPSGRTFEAFTAKIFTSNAATFQMAASHLSRLGVSSSPILEEELISSTNWKNCILVVDCDRKKFTPEIEQQLSSADAPICIVLTRLTGDMPSSIFSNWTTISKPITSKSLYDALARHFDPEAATDYQPSNIPKTVNSKRKRILVAEDVDTNQQIITEMISLLGHEVEIASNGQIAVAKYLSSEYSLIFMDCQMPTMDGYEATREIREIESKRQIQPVPIIALTAGSDKEDRHRCLEAGMTGYLTKPFSLSDIKNIVESHCHLRQGISNIVELDDNDRKYCHQVEYSSAGEPQSKVLNSAAIESIRDVERQTGKQLLPSIFAGYVRQMDEKLQDIERDILAQDSTSIYRTAHAIKSMSANIGAERVRSISSRIETKGRENQLVGMAESVIVLTEAYHEFIDEFDISFAIEPDPAPNAS